MKLSRPVVGIPPSYDDNQNLETKTTKVYLKFLQDRGAYCVMTTAGTSQFNLLETEEIHELNQCVVSSFDHQKILGIPQLSTINAVKFAKRALQYMDEATELMALYPDRFYGENVISDYVKSISDAVGKPIYLHAQNMRHGSKSWAWNYTSDLINKLSEDDKTLRGIKEEHPNLQAAYGFIRGLNKNIDVIVAGGSMRRYQFLESAGANAFLSGIGNILPLLENMFFNAKKEERTTILDIEANFFDFCMQNGWHKSLRESLKLANLTCFNNRNPWPKTDSETLRKLTNVYDTTLKRIKYAK